MDFSADPNKVLEILTAIANDMRNEPEYKDLFLADPQILGVDSVKGSQLIFPVVFKTKPTKQYAPVREFQRRVRLALEENHMLPGDPMRVFNTFDVARESGAARWLAAGGAWSGRCAEGGSDDDQAAGDESLQRRRMRGR